MDSMITGAGGGPDSPIDSRIGLEARTWFVGLDDVEEKPRFLTALSM
jgi:hypothetical protein